MRDHICLDLETTGLDKVNDRIVQIAIKDMFTGVRHLWLLNPQIPISPEATEIHGISDEDVEDYPTFEDIHIELAKSVNARYISGFNQINFDIPMLVNEFARCKLAFPNPSTKFIDGFVLERKRYPMSLSASYKRVTGEEMEGAHDAMIDVEGTEVVLKSQQDHFGVDLDELAEMSGSNSIVDWDGRFKKNQEGVIEFNFSKYRGQRVDTDNYSHVNFMNWMKKQDWLTHDTRNWIKRLTTNQIF